MTSESTALGAAVVTPTLFFSTAALSATAQSWTKCSVPTAKRPCRNQPVYQHARCDQSLHESHNRRMHAPKHGGDLHRVTLAAGVGTCWCRTKVIKYKESKYSWPTDPLERGP